MSRSCWFSCWCCALALVLQPGFPGQPSATAGWIVLHDKNGLLSHGIANATVRGVAEMAKQGVELTTVAFAPRGGWVILYGQNGFLARNIPDEAFQKLRELAKQGARLNAIAFGPDGGWVILYDKNGFVAKDIPDEAYQKLGELAGKGAALKALAFTPKGGWAILFDRNGYFTRNIPDDAFAKLGELGNRGAEIKALGFAPNGGWAILHDSNGSSAKNLPHGLGERLDGLAKRGAALKTLAFTVTLPIAEDDEASRQIVLERMAHYHVPGMSVALIQDDGVLFTRVYGVVNTVTKRPVGKQTRFQAASISKPVTSVAALRLVERGKMTLDGDLNKFLASWKIPENEFTREKPVALRQIVTHSAGFTVGGFGGYERGAKLPSLLDILNGKPPANSPAIRVNFLPGSKTRYSGGGFTVLQQALIDVEHRPFPALLDDLVLGPLKMTQSAFQQPPGATIAKDAASGHRNGKPIAGDWHIYPELAAAGLWTTPSDLARFVLGIQHAWRGSPGAILSPDLAKQMLTRQIGNWGLGVDLDGKGPSLSFRHNGVNVGFESQLLGFAQSGQGAVIMTNANSAGRLMDEVMQSLRLEYQWPE